MRVADFVPSDPTFAIFRDLRLAREPVVDLAGSASTKCGRCDPKGHSWPDYRRRVSAASHNW